MAKPMTLANAIGTARDSGMLRADHYLHLRCEVPMPSVVEEAAALIGRMTCGSYR